jgi:5-methylcytosine-specific restriction endonuclease McrA
VFCEQQGKVEPATELDHIVKHNGDPELFFDNTNWQGLCYTCHRSTKAQMERSGKVKGSARDGTPLDPNHHWSMG